MQDRRNFLKRILAGGVALGLGSGASIKKANALPAVDNAGKMPKGYAWQRTIFCQFASPSLASSICWLAMDLGCDIYWGEPLSPDIIAVPCFVLVVDRNTVGREQWADYLEFRKEVEDTNPCILVDKLGASGVWPVDNHMEIRNPGNRVSANAIIRRIQDAHKTAQDWKPADLV